MSSSEPQSDQVLPAPLQCERSSCVCVCPFAPDEPYLQSPLTSLHAAAFRFTAVHGCGTEFSYVNFVIKIMKFVKISRVFNFAFFTKSRVFPASSLKNGFLSILMQLYNISHLFFSVNLLHCQVFVSFRNPFAIYPKFNTVFHFKTIVSFLYKNSGYCIITCNIRLI